MKIMKNYLLIYGVNDYAEMGGGTYVEYCDNISDLEDKVNKLNEEYKERFSIEFACEVKSEIEFKPVEKIIRFEADI